MIANDALGNYVVSTPLLQMLRRTYPQGSIHYYSGSRAQELWGQDPNIDTGFALYGTSPRESAASVVSREPYHLVINLESSPWAKAFAAVAASEDTFVVGPALGPTGRDDLPFGDDDRGDLARDREWIASDLVQRYPFLQTSFIAEIFARLAYLPGEVPLYAVPQQDPGAEIPSVLIATAASLPEKLWPAVKWAEVLRRLKAEGRTVGLLGAPPKAQQQFWKGNEAEDGLVAQGLVEDLRGRFTLPQVAGALARAGSVLTLDNGILHLAAAVKAPTVGLFRHGIHRLWAPPSPCLKVLTPGEGRNVDSIEVDAVLEALALAR